MAASRSCLRCGFEERYLRRTKTPCNLSLFPDIKRGASHKFVERKSGLERVKDRAIEVLRNVPPKYLEPINLFKNNEKEGGA